MGGHVTPQMNLERHMLYLKFTIPVYLAIIMGN